MSLRLIMRYAIIDNSTLTAVQRLLGQAPIVNKLCLDGRYSGI